nr:hypothetical protein [Pseudomonadota bacterium]
KEHLAAPWRGKITGLSAADRALCDAVIFLRNFVAHDSPAASARANASLNALKAKDAALKLGENKLSRSGIGRYLNATTAGGKKRVEVFHDRLDAVAALL